MVLTWIKKTMRLSENPNSFGCKKSNGYNNSCVQNINFLLFFWNTNILKIMWRCLSFQWYDSADNKSETNNSAKIQVTTQEPSRSHIDRPRQTDTDNSYMYARVPIGDLRICEIVDGALIHTLKNVFANVRL